MIQENVAYQRHTIKTFLQVLATYVSLLTPLIGAFLAWRGLTEAKYIFLFYAFLPPAVAFVWLRSQYRLAKARMEKDGVVQHPAWLWKLITNKIPHKSEQLLESQVMVFVPPTKEAYASRLDEEYNADGNHVLLFHYLPGQIDDGVDEGRGRISYDGEVRSLETLASEMNECAALILLDDTKWHEEYPKTLEVVEGWTKRHTVRPVMSVHLEGRGTLKYSWSRFEDLVRPPHSLKNRLLAQAANRGAKWFWQATLNRRIVLWVLGTALLTAIVALYFWQQAETMEDYVATYEKINSTDSSAKQETARAFTTFRRDLPRPVAMDWPTPSAVDSAIPIPTSSSAPLPKPKPEGERLRVLLRVYADQIRTTLASASGQVDAITGSVMMFAVQHREDLSRQEDTWRIEEVAATRIPPNQNPFFATLKKKKDKSDPTPKVISGMVICAVVNRAFVLWSGEWNEKTVNTTNIQAWDLTGKSVGAFYQHRILIDDNLCEYAERTKEDLHRTMLCAPVGQDLNSVEIAPAGAICVSYTQDVKFLNEKWVRETIARFGTSLSFAWWDTALPMTIGDTTPTVSNKENPIVRKKKKARRKKK